MSLLSKETKRKLEDVGESIASPFRGHRQAAEVRSSIDAMRDREDAAEASAARQEAEKRDPVRGQKAYKKGGVTRADGCVTKGHTKGRML